MKTVTVIGLGVMGAALARALLVQGFTVSVWNRSSAKAEPLVNLGATAYESVTDAVAASEVIVSCVSTHRDTIALLEAAAAEVKGKHVIELSSGEPNEAQELCATVESHGGQGLVGVILSFPGGIGTDAASVTTAGDQTVWEHNQDVLSALAGKLSYISADPKALAIMFAALFLPRQGYMFGMVYGALLCEKAGVPVDAYINMLPQLDPLLKDYLEVVSSSIPSGDFSKPPASLETIAAAYRDALAPFRELDISREVPEAMAKIVDQGIAAGFGAEQMSAIIKTLR